MTCQAEAIIGLYQRHAWARDSSDRLLEQTWLERFCRLLGPGAGVLDIGCGSGEPLARYFIEKGHAVTGVDAALAMIAICQSQFPKRNWRVADMRTLSLDATFSGILAWDSFFHDPHCGRRTIWLAQLR